MGAYPILPAALADHVTMTIVYDCRHQPLDQAPLPRPKEKRGPNNTFHVDPQWKLQSPWSDRLGRLGRLGRLASLFRER
jgi:hypothetical protein